jgi:DNA-binding MarR family transcriptional regulator
MNPSSKATRVTPVEYERLASFRYALRRFLRFSEEAAIAAGVPPHQHQALLAIKGFSGQDQPITVGELAERLQIAHHSAVGLVQRLIKEDLVQKQQALQDRRQMQLRLSTHGEEILSKLSSIHREELRRIAPQLQTLLDQFANAG